MKLSVYSQIVYLQSLADVLEGKKQIYVGPQQFPPEYDEDEGPGNALDEEDRTNEILKDLEITDYDNVEKILNETGMTPTKIRSFLNNKVLKLAKFWIGENNQEVIRQKLRKHTIGVRQEKQIGPWEIKEYMY